MRAFLGLSLIAGCWHEPAAVVAPIEPAPSAPIARTPMRRVSPYAQVAGTWKGTGFQYDTKGTWDIVMTLQSHASVGEVIGTIAYENGGCTANLIREEERDNQLVMRERLVTGHGRCVDNGWVRIPKRPTANELDWRWDFADQHEGASSTVKRESD